MVSSQAVQPVRIFLSLGSNSGDRQENLKTAIDKLGETPGIELMKLSPLYETAHIGPAAPDHLNCALEIETVLPAEALLFYIEKIERELGRDKANETRWGERTIDIDIALYGDLQIQNEKLIVPHGRLCERRFMLEPLAQIAGEVIVPGFNATVSKILAWPSNQVEGVKQVEWED
jgi:2-amino-4-hydroxy-6-hydroxymethyldihydropteridine diphosphokinase